MTDSQAAPQDRRPARSVERGESHVPGSRLHPFGEAGSDDERAGGRAGPLPAPLSAYVPRLALRWMREQPERRHLAVDGTLAFVDVSGFTVLTERLAVLGRVGAEEITDVVGTVFTELARLAAGDGADLLKWGGDAALLLFEGDSSAERAARASWKMVQAMARVGRLRTSKGRVQLRVSVGIHSGPIELFLLGDLHRELMVAGRSASATALMESIAQGGEVVVSMATADRLASSGNAHVLGPAREAGVLLTGEATPAVEWTEPALRPADGDGVAAVLLPEGTRRHLSASGEHAEHRPVAVGFLQVSGLDQLIERNGAELAAELLDPLVCVAQRAADENGASFHATDLASDGVKIIVLGGVPTLHGNDADRLLRAALEIVGAASARTGAVSTSPRSTDEVALLGALAAAGVSVRAGINAGTVFAFASDLGLGGRRIFSITGDAVNLAARVAAAAAPGQVRCTVATREALRATFDLVELEPFVAKGKAEPVVSFEVRRELGALPAVGASRQRSGFVGRGQELAVLLETARAVAAGTGAVVEVVGPAGIGKSRLIDEAVARWRLPTARLAGDSFGIVRPYRALRPFARRLLMLDDDAAPADVERALFETLEAKAPALRAWAPMLGDVLDVTLPPTTEVRELDPRFRRRRLESSFVEMVAALVDGPFALVLEDAHGLDEASASLAIRMAEEAGERPWLVVATRRPEGAGIPPGMLEDRTIVELGALDPESAGRLLGGLADDVLQPGERDALVERAAGNPLFLLELGRAVAQSGSTDALPDALEPLLLTQIDQLSPPDRAVLRAAALLGLRFSETLLADVLDDPVYLDDEVFERLSDFVERGADGWSFRHALLRDAAYEGLSFRRRRELHARAAQVIEARAARPEDAAEQLSVHWLAAEQWQHAWRYARLAGERAEALYAPRDAATHYRRALAAARHLRGADAEQIATVYERLGDVCELTGAYEKARSAYDAARCRFRDPLARARLVRKIGSLSSRGGHLSQALRAYSRAARLLPDEGSEAAVERSELSRVRASALHRQGRLSESIAEADRATHFAELAGYRRGLANALNIRFVNLVLLNEAGSEKPHATATATGGAAATHGGASVHMESLDELGQRVLEIYREVHDVRGQGLVLNHLGVSSYLRGDWDQALHYYAAGRDAHARAGDLVEMGTADNNIGEILSHQGHLEEAGRRLEAARLAFHAARYGIGTAVVTLTLGLLARRRDEPAEAMELFRQAHALFETIGADNYVTESTLRLLESSAGLGELTSTAEGAAELAARVARRHGHERVHAGALRLHGVLLARLGSLAEAERPLDAAVRQFRELGDDFELAIALLARASLRRKTIGASRTVGAPASLRAGDRGADGADPIAAASAVVPDGPVPAEEHAARDAAEAAAIFDRMVVIPAARDRYAAEVAAD